ncbi:hypothetical protein BG000_007458 [Podila horticola]|nr:hypothetical protein BG000_007458 [Podila horticola]
MDKIEFLEIRKAQSIPNQQVELQCRVSLDMDYVASGDDDEEEEERDEDQTDSVCHKDLEWLHSIDFWDGWNPPGYTEVQKQSSMRKLVQIYKTLKEITQARVDQSKKEIKFSIDWCGPLFKSCSMTTGQKPAQLPR